ncbi:MAG: GspE/PulE family protein [Fimbriimonadaceae bacterium]
MQATSNNRTRLGELLLSLKLLKREELDQGLSMQRETAAPLGSILVSLGYIREEQLLNALAAQDGVSPWRIDERPPTQAALIKVPPHVCRALQVIPVRVQGDLLVLAMRNPLDLDAIDMVRNLTGQRIEPVLAEEGRLGRAIDRFCHDGASTGAVDGFVNEALVQFNASAVAESQESLITEKDTRPVVGLVNQVLSDAIRMGASDVHIEPRADRVDIRYRVDGELLKVRDIPLSLHPMFVARLKIMADMDIVEFRLPLDGRVTAQIDGRSVDIRVSTLPNQHGQRVVLRILDKSRSLKKLSELGINAECLATFRSLLHRPYGIMLVTGPTGCGKTTTLYAAMEEIRRVSRNIMTCEDPIEYEIDGISQSQVNEKVGLSFVSQLRATLRQDPDIILVGEIRDAETAETAIRAALTGHLVLSTLHCNDAPSAVPRLLDMGVDPFLLSSSLIGVMSQRLVRTTCNDCKGAATPKNPCRSCGEAGFRGRVAVAEIMRVNSAVAAAIGNRSSMDDVLRAAVAAGYRPMSVAAEALAASGRTTIAEAQRHVFFSDAEQPVIQLRAA